MSASKSFLFRIANGRLIGKLRRGAGTVVGPQFRDHIVALHEVELSHNHHITSLYHTRLEHNHRITQLEERATGATSADLERHMPEVLNAISSTHGIARMLRREVEAIKEQHRDELESLKDQQRQEAAETAARLDELDRHSQRLDGHIQNDVWPLAAKVGGVAENAKTVAWLVQRVETVRAEMLHELRYGSGSSLGGEPAIEIEIVNPAALVDHGDGVRLNLGCGHVIMEGFANVDMRKLPGVDIVAPAHDLPVEPGSVDEIFSSHVLEHFPEQELVRTLLPYWFETLRPGGTFRAVVPDLESMITAFSAGDMTFENLRQVTYGGQEYDGDFHFNGFTGESLGRLLKSAGFRKVKVLASGRPNGDCLEFEISAHRPT